MLFEFRITNPAGHSVYQQHRFIEMMLCDARGGWQSRDYIWCESDGLLFVRRTYPTDDLQWQAVNPPSQGSRVTLQVTARCRMSTNEEETLFGRKLKRYGARPKISD